MRKRRQDIIKQGTLGFTKAQSLKPKAGTHRVPFPCLLALFLLACGSSVPQMPTTPEQPKTPETPEEPEIPGMEGATSGGGRSGGGRGGCRTFPVSVFLNAHKDMNRNREGQAMPVEVSWLTGRPTSRAFPPGSGSGECGFRPRSQLRGSRGFSGWTESPRSLFPAGISKDPNRIGRILSTTISARPRRRIQ